MGIIDRIKMFFGIKARKMLESGNVPMVKDNNDNLQGDFRRNLRVRGKGETKKFNVEEEYVGILKDMKNYADKEEELREAFFDSLIEVFGYDEGYSQKHKKELEARRNVSVKELNTIIENIKKSGRDVFSSKAYEKKYDEILGIVWEIATIKDTISECMQKMMNNYKDNPTKFEGPKKIFEKMVKNNISLKEKMTDTLALEDAVLSHVTQEGKFSEEQTDVLDKLSDGFVSGDIQTFVGKRKDKIENELIGEIDGYYNEWKDKLIGYGDVTFGDVVNLYDIQMAGMISKRFSEKVKQYDGLLGKESVSADILIDNLYEHSTKPMNEERDENNSGVDER